MVNSTKKKRQRPKQRVHFKTKTKTKSQTFRTSDYHSGDGFQTQVWGPTQWHMLHTMSFNYPVHPTTKDKAHYRAHIQGLQHVLPCRYCRENLTKNLAKMPLTDACLANRDAFSRYVYRLHEQVNTMLNKPSGLTYEQVRERYEHFRSRCTKEEWKQKQKEQQESMDRLRNTDTDTGPNSPSPFYSHVDESTTKTKRVIKGRGKGKGKEKGCVEPLYGKKSKCIIHIVPQTKQNTRKRFSSIQISKCCLRKRMTKPNP